MTKVVSRDKGPKTPRLGMGSTCRLMIGLAAAWVLVGLINVSARAENLRWNFKEGEVLHYSIETKSSMTAKGMDKERKSSQVHTLDVIWTVKSVDANGVAEIALRYDRVRMRREMPPLMTFVFDSEDTKAAVQEGFEAETQQLKAIVGGEVGFKIRPTGDIEDVKIPETTLKRLREGAPRGTADDEVSEKAIKDMLLQSSPPSFPEGDLEPGKSWSRKPSKMPLGFATMTMQQTLTFQGPDSKSPNLLLVGVESKVSLEPAEGASIRAAIRKQECRGSLTFDSTAGKVAGARVTQRIDMTISMAGQTMEQISDTTTSMSLIP